MSNVFSVLVHKKNFIPPSPPKKRTHTNLFKNFMTFITDILNITVFTHLELVYFILPLATLASWQE